MMMNMRNINYFVQLCVGSNDDAGNFNTTDMRMTFSMIANEKQRHKKMKKR